MAKLSYVKRVANFLKLDEEGKVSKFQKQATKEWRKQIALRQAKIAELEEKKEELREEKTDEVVLNVDINRLGDIEARKNYIPVYMQNLLRLKDNIAQEDAEIEKLKEEIEGFEYMISLVTD